MSERSLCCRCLRARAFCYCARLKPFCSRFQFVILQHPLERKKTTGTARMTHLSIGNSLLISGVDFDENPVVRNLVSRPENHCVVLYPGAKSKNISLPECGKPGTWIPEEKRLVIFVIDGSWPCAKRMISRSPELFPCRKFASLH